jgi:hypothetical protein
VGKYRIQNTNFPQVEAEVPPEILNNVGSLNFRLGRLEEVKA